MAIKISCPNCDRKYNLADTMAGKTIRCKDCEKQFRVDDPDAEDGLISEADARRRRSTIGAKSRKADFDDEDEDDRPRRRSRYRDEDDDDRPRKKKSKAGGVPVALLVGGGVGLLLIIGVVILLVCLLGGNGKLTAENVAKLKQGMTEQEVIDLLGTPTATVDPGKAADNMPKLGGDFGKMADQMNKAFGQLIPKTMTWNNNKDINVTVTFAAGKVTGWVGGPKLDNAVANNPAPNPNPNPFANPNPNPNPVPNPMPMPEPDPDPNAITSKPGGQMTPENMNRVQLGMSQRQVVELLGQPNQRLLVSQRRGNVSVITKVLKYNSGSEVYSYEFQNNQLIKKP